VYVSEFVKHGIDFGWHISDGVIPLGIVVTIVVKYGRVPITVGCDENVWVCIVFIVRVGALLDIR
jgi:hypothetical protein